MTAEQERICDNGIFYTPENLAENLVDGLRDRLHDIDGPRILDPSCGQGALLSAAQKTIDASGVSHVQAPTFVGCDLFEPKEWPEDSRFDFKKGNFLDQPLDGKFDAILMNPPYIQSGRIPNTERKKLYDNLAREHGFGKNLDLWVFFVLKAMEHLKDDGSIAIVIPWSLIEAQFAHAVRAHLATMFKDISVAVLRDRHFDSTEKRVLLMWLKGFGKPAERIRMAFSGTVADSYDFRKVGKKEWEASDMLSSHGLRSNVLLQTLKDSGFSPLSDFADVRIGVVTGANKFFILPASEANALGFSAAATVPIFTHVEELGDLTCQSSPSKVLIQFPSVTKKRKRYLQEGVQKEFHDRSHSKRRITANRQWYEVDAGRAPDAFFTYRVSKIPFMILNPKKSQCTNTLHKIFFKKGVRAATKKWIQLSLLSDAGQLSIEAGARHYGNGILKVEPNLLKNALVYASNEPVPPKEYSAVSKAFKANNKEEASRLATEALKKVCVGDETMWANIAEALREVRHRRNGVE